MRMNTRHRLVSALVAAVLVLLPVSRNAAPAAAQGGGGSYTLTWGGASGGAGASSGGSFSVSGTAGQPETQQLRGGNFGLTGGFVQPICPAGAAQAVTVTLGRSDADITLSWTHQTANGAYEVHRSTTPFFTPGPNTLFEMVFAPANSYTNEGAAGDPDGNHFYLVRARCGGLWGDSNRTGLFGFRLVPGQ